MKNEILMHKRNYKKLDNQYLSKEREKKLSDENKRLQTDMEVLQDMLKSMKI
jgi:hypothetical protein